MSGLPSRPHDRSQGAASSSLFTDHSRHFMTDRVRIQIAHSKNSSASSRRSDVDLWLSQPGTVGRAPPHFAKAGVRKTPNHSTPCQSLSLLTVCSPHFAHHSPIKTHSPHTLQRFSPIH